MKYYNLARWYGDNKSLTPTNQPTRPQRTTYFWNCRDSVGDARNSGFRRISGRKSVGNHPRNKLTAGIIFLEVTPPPLGSCLKNRIQAKPTGIIKSPIWRGMEHYKCMINLKDFPLIVQEVWVEWPLDRGLNELKTSTPTTRSSEGADAGRSGPWFCVSFLFKYGRVEAHPAIFIHLYNP